MLNEPRGGVFRHVNLLVPPKDPRAAAADRPAILPAISGQAWITGAHRHMLDPTDPWPQGYRLSDTWPR